MFSGVKIGLDCDDDGEGEGEEDDEDAEDGVDAEGVIEVTEAGEERSLCSIMARRGATPVPGPMQIMGVEGEVGRDRIPGVMRKEIGEPTRQK